MDHNRLTKITRNGELNISTVSKRLLRTFDINIIEKQADCIKHSTSFYKKMKKKRKTLVKIEDFETHH